MTQLVLCLLVCRAAVTPSPAEASFHYGIDDGQSNTGKSFGNWNMSGAPYSTVSKEEERNVRASFVFVYYYYYSHSNIYIYTCVCVCVQGGFASYNRRGVSGVMAEVSPRNLPPLSRLQHPQQQRTHHSPHLHGQVGEVERGGRERGCESSKDAIQVVNTLRLLLQSHHESPISPHHVQMYEIPDDEQSAQPSAAQAAGTDASAPTGSHADHRFSNYAS